MRKRLLCISKRCSFPIPAVRRVSFHSIFPSFDAKTMRILRNFSVWPLECRMSLVFRVVRINSQGCLQHRHRTLFLHSLAFLPLINMLNYERVFECARECGVFFLFVWWNQNSNELHGILPVLFFILHTFALLLSLFFCFLFSLRHF